MDGDHTDGASLEPSSGVEVTDEVTAAFNRLKSGAKDLHYVIYEIENNHIIKIKRDAAGKECWKLKDKDNPLDEGAFMELFKEESFYMVMDFKFGGLGQEKIVFIQWVPEDSKVQQKMMYASSAQSLKDKLSGVTCKIEANDTSEITFEEISKVVACSTGNRSL